MRKIYSIAVACLLSAGCATTPEWAVQKTKILESDEYKRERAEYVKRLGRSQLCDQVGISQFLSRYAPKPDPECVYPASYYELEKTWAGNKARQGLRTLKVLQAGPAGFLVVSGIPEQMPYGYSPAFPAGKAIFIHRTDETGVVDGDFLDATHDFATYEYAGPYSYVATSGGQRTIHSFRRISANRLKEAGRDLNVFEGFTREFFIKNGVWDLVGEQ